MDHAVTYDRRIRYSDCDSQGIVFNPRYLVYWDDTITDWAGALGFSWPEVAAAGQELVLARSEVDHRASARLGDLVRTGARVARIGRTSLTFQMRSWSPDDDTTFVEGRLVEVMVDATHFRPTPVPDWLVERVLASQPTHPPERA